MGIKAELNLASNFKVDQVSLAFKIPFTERIIRLTAQAYQDPNAWSRGIGSECKDGLHVLFFDYDGKNLQQVTHDILRIQKQECLPHAYIFAMDRPDSFHVIILAKFTFSEAGRILRLSNSDAGHQSSAKKVRGHEWLLRTCKKGERKKPKYIGYMDSKHDLFEISSAHKIFIENYYDDVPKLKYTLGDKFGINDIPIIDYNTGNRTETIAEEFKEVIKNE